MKIINAMWEKRNLNVNTIEIRYDILDNNVSINELEINYNKIIEKYHPKYIVLKIPGGCAKLLQFVKLLNFQFIETQISLSVKMEDINKSKFTFYKKHKEFTCKMSKNRNDFDNVVAKIGDKTFYTDRVAFDEKFGVSKSNFRYKNWIKDLKKNDDVILFLLYKDNINYGFHIGSLANERFSGYIGGVYYEYQKNMYGGFWAYGLIDELINKCKKIVCPVSSNNIKVIKLWENFGFCIENMEYIYIKHID